MPSDNRRNNGPEDSRDYYNFVSKLVIPEENQRPKSRLFNEQRKIYLQTGVCLHVKGSCYLEAGITKLIATATEPREIPRLQEFTPNGELACEFKYAPFSSRTRRSPVPDATEKHLALNLRRALEPAVCRHEFPNFQVEVNILVLDDDGSVLSSAITAASLALANAGIPLYDTISSVSMGVTDGNFFVDPNLEEEDLCLSSKDNSGLICVACLPSLGQISLLHFEGCINPSVLEKNLDLLLEKCALVGDLVKLRLTKDVQGKLSEENQLIS